MEITRDETIMTLRAEMQGMWWMRVGVRETVRETVRQGGKWEKGRRPHPQALLLLPLALLVSGHLGRRVCRHCFLNLGSLGE